MKKSVWSAYFINETPEEMVELFEQAGYNYSELSYEHGDMLIERGGDIIKTGKEFKAFAKGHGISFPQGHVPLNLKICQSKADMETMKRYLDLYAAIGIKYCVIHCDKFIGLNLTLDEIRERNIVALKELGEYVKDTELVICIENLNVFPITAGVILNMLTELDENHFAICLDTGHLHMNNGDLIEFIRKAGHRIKALHIADNEGKTDQHMMPCGKGSIDFVSVFKEIKKFNYGELYNLEIPGENRAPREVLMAKLEYISKMMDILDKLSDEDGKQ